MRVLLFFLISGVSFNCLSQGFFSDLNMRSDSSNFSSTSDTFLFQGVSHLPFSFDEENETVEVIAVITKEFQDYQFQLINSADFQVIDSLLPLGGSLRFKVRFNNLTSSQFLKFTFAASKDSLSLIQDFPLFPFRQTFMELDEPKNSLFIGEEKSIQIRSNAPQNLILSERWQNSKNMSWRFSRDGSSIQLHMLPNKIGNQTFKIGAGLKKPVLTDGKFSFQLDSIELSVNVDAGRLAFLSFDKGEVTPNDDKLEPVLVQIENHRSLVIGKTYRLENQEEKGGPLIAEIFTRSRMTNDRVLCELRPYAFHRKSEGYLYLKDGDYPRFVTNLDITPKTSIDKIFIQREGSDWKESNSLYPGEVVGIRLEGNGLHKSDIIFSGAKDISTDTLIRNENLAIFNISVPENIRSKSIEVFNGNKSTGKSLSIREYELAREFDFISLELGDSKFPLNSISKPIYYGTTLTDLVVKFDHEKIDQNKLHGPQQLDLEIKVFNKAGNLLEIYQINDHLVCPGPSSPRSEFYGSGNCDNQTLNFNDLLSKKTYDLEEWSRIELVVSHDKSKYNAGVSQKKVRIYLKRDYNFDIDVSFPAGLLILKGNSDQFTNFSGGISFAMIGQFSFYQKGKIAKYKPFKVGAGFIAIDALNFSENSSNRDVAIVAIGSLYPISSNRKLTFPLYTGFGFLIQERRPFFLVGPGIRVRF